MGIVMNKGLDLIQRQQLEAIDGCPTGNVYVGLTFEELAELEKELKAVEIIRSHLCGMGGIDGTYEGPKNTYVIELKNVCPDKYDLLKEVLK